MATASYIWAPNSMQYFHSPHQVNAQREAMYVSPSACYAKRCRLKFTLVLIIFVRNKKGVRLI